MAVQTCTLSGNIGDITGAPLIAVSGVSAVRKLRVEWNLPAGATLVDVAGNEQRVPVGPIPVNLDGSWSIAGLVRSNSTGTNLDLTGDGVLQYRVVYEVSSRAYSSGWFSLTTATAKLADLVMTQDLPPSFLSQAIAEFRAIAQGYVDDAEAAAELAVDISNIGVPDDVVEALVKGTGGAGPKTRAALTSTIARTAQTHVEVLAPWSKALRQTPAAAKVALVGDSTYDSGAAGVALHNAIKAQMKTGLPLEGMVDAGILNFGYNGQTTAQITSDAHMADLAAAAPSLVIAGPGINDVRTRALTNRTADVAWLRAILVTGFEKIRAAVPGVPIVASMPNSFLTTDVGGAGYVTNGNPQECSAIIREAYLALADTWPDVIVVDTQAKVFGTTAVATTPYMSDQIHPSSTGANAKVADLMPLIGYYRPRATGRSAAALVAAPYTPWTSYARDVEDDARYELVLEANWQNQGTAGSDYLDIDLPAAQRNRCRRGLIISLPGAQAAFQIPMAGGGFSVNANASFTRLLFNAGTIPAGTITGGKVRFYRQRYGGDATLESVIKDTVSWRFKRLFRVVSATATAVTLAPIPDSAQGTTDSAGDLAAIIAAGDVLYVEGDAAIPTPLAAGQAVASSGNIVVSGLTRDYSTGYANRLVAIVGTHSAGTPGQTGAPGPASGYGSALISGRASAPSISGPLSTAAVTAGNEYAVALAPLASGSIIKLQIQVSTAAASAVARLGVRGSTGGLPDAVLVDAGTVDCSSTGVKSITLATPLPVVAGQVYWLSLWCTGAGFTPVTINGVSPLVTMRDGVANDAHTGYIRPSGSTDGPLSAWGATYTPTTVGPLIRAVAA